MIAGQPGCTQVVAPSCQTRSEWLHEKKLGILLQLALKKSPELPDVPLVFDYVNTTADRQLLELMVATKAVALPFATPPGVPPARLETLRRAFDATMKDPEFLTEVRKMLFDSSPTSGEETYKII